MAIDAIAETVLKKREIGIGVAHSLFLIRKQQKSDNAAAVL